MPQLIIHLVRGFLHRKFYTISNYGGIGIAFLGLGIITFVWTAKRNEKPKAALILGVLLFDFLYYLVYGPSNSGMVLPFFGYASIMIALGVVLTPFLISNFVPVKRDYKISLIVVVALVVGGLLVHPLISRPWVDYSDRNGPAKLVSKMADHLPAGSEVRHTRWVFRQIFSYYKIVEGVKAPFQWSGSRRPCKEEVINKNKCFSLRKSLKTKEDSPNIYTIPYLNAGNSTLYQVKDEENVPELQRLIRNNPSPPVGAIKITKIDESTHRIELGQIGHEEGDPIKGQKQGMKYKLTLKANNLENRNFQEWPPDETTDGYVIKGGVWRLGADSLYAYGLREISLTLTQREGNFAPDFNAYYVDLVSNPIEFNTIVSDVTTARLKKESWRVTESSSE